MEALERPRFRAVTSEDTYVVAESLLYEDCVNRHNTVESRVFFVATDDGDVVGWTHLDLLQVDTPEQRETDRRRPRVVPAPRRRKQTHRAGDRLGRGQRLPETVQQRPVDEVMMTYTV